jgi:hypothetical protein
MTTPNNLSRRLFLQRAAVGTLMATGGSTLLAACASGGTDDNTGGGGADKTADNPFGVNKADPLDVVIFKGGYGDDYAKFHESLYKKKFPDSAIKHAGITDITPQLQPRFNGGNPPDVIDNSGAKLLPVSTLATSGQLADLTPLFDAASIDDPNVKVKDSVEKITLEALLEVKQKGYIMQGTEGLDHIQSQTAWNQGKAAFIPSGSWLENEQKPVAPKDFLTTVAYTPLLDGAKLPVDCTEISAGEGFIVPEKAKNKAGGMEYLRLMLSKEGAGKFTELTGSPTVVKGAGEGLTLSPGAASSSALLKSGSDNNWSTYFGSWYSTMSDPMFSIVGELVAARITADEFQKRAQKLADQTAKDPKTVKRTRS